MAISSVEISLDDNLREKAVKIYSQLGLDLTTAIQMFLQRSVLVNGLPFSTTLQSNDYKAKLALKAMQELSDASAKNGARNMSLEEINEEIFASRRERETIEI